MRTVIQKEKLILTAGLFFTAMLVLLLGMTRMGFFYAPILRFHALITFIFLSLTGLIGTYLWVKYAPKIPPAFLFFSLNIAWGGVAFTMGVSPNRLWVVIPYVLLITLAGFSSIKRQKMIWLILTLILGSVIILFITPSMIYTVLIIVQSAMAVLFVFKEIYLPRLIALFSLLLPGLLLTVLALVGSSQWHLDEAKWAEIELYGAIPGETLTITASLESVLMDSSLRVNVYQKRGLGFIKHLGQAEYLDQWMMPELEATAFNVTQQSDTAYAIQLSELEPLISIEID